MVGQERAEQVAEIVLAASPGNQTEVVISGSESRLTRFAQSAVHQNMSEDDTAVSVRVVLQDRVGLATTNKLDETSLRNVLNRACEQALRSVANPFASALALPSEYPRVPAYDEKTAGYTPEDRVDRVREIVDITASHGAVASGVVATSVGELLVANSAGVTAYSPWSEARASVIASTPCGYGYAGAISRRADDMDIRAMAERAAEKSSAFGSPIGLPEGDYEVILEPPAVETLISFLSMMSFGARSFHENRSFMSDRLGEKVVGANITLWDDATDSRGLTIPFDFEGVPKRKVEFITNGVAVGVAYDTETAALYGTRSTGHALPPEAKQYTSDPAPANLVMQGGNQTLEDMIASTERGILVTRFHYANVVHQLKGIVTGMTRDGTFLVEDGRVTSAVRNLRFTQSVPEALEHVSMLTKEMRLEPGEFYGSAIVPSLKIDRFHFTGTTEH